MNIINAQVEVLKEALKKKNTVIYGVLDDKVIIGNGNRLYIIPKKECGVDLTNIDSNNVKIMQESSLKNFMNDNLCENVTLTDDKKVVDKKTLRVFSKGDENIYVDESLIKYFDLENSTFKGRNKKSPIYIYEDYKMVGLVLPFIVYDKIKKS